MNIASNISSIRAHIPEGVTLICVSKFHPMEAIMEAYEAGERDFGESRVQELAQKNSVMPNDVQWHFIGHLQTNKVRQLVPYVSLIHSIDSLRLLECVNTEAAKIDRVVDVLLQLHVAKEETKFGFTCEECLALVASGKVDELKNVRICGVMGMATNTDDMDEVRAEFKAIKGVFDELKNSYGAYDYFGEEAFLNAKQTILEKANTIMISGIIRFTAASASSPINRPTNKPSAI